jgi:NADH:ubiquinone oxidoreductase subunit 2 (subunit N)
VFLIVVGVGTVAIGRLLGVNQTSVRKIIALSSVAHLGWLILGFSTLTQKGCFFIFLCYIVTVLPMI